MLAIRNGSTDSTGKSLRRFDSLFKEFDEFFGKGHSPMFSGSSGYSNVHTEKTDDAVILHLEVPGCAPEDVEVSVKDDMLIVQAQRTGWVKSINRKFWVPNNIAREGIEAKVVNGMLTVVLPYDEKRSLKIEVSG